MPISATFQADFTMFSTAVSVAQTKLKGFEESAKQVTTSLTRMEDSISGVAIVKAAAVATEAVERLGGVSKLTYAELQRIGSTAQDAVTKLQALGQSVPKGIQDLADRARGAAEEMLRLAGATNEVQTSTSLLSGAAARLVGAFSVGALVGFGKEILDAGDQIQKMSDQTGLSIEQVQRLNYVAGQSGTSMDALVGAVQNLQARLGDDNSGAAAALKKLNINFETFKALDPYTQLITLADAVQSIKDPTEQASTAAALFGKTWKEILPAIKSGMADVAKQAPVMADATVHSLDRVGDALLAAKQQGVAWGGGMVLAFEQVGFAAGDFLSTFNPEHFGVANSMLLEIEGHLNDPDGIKGAFAKIPPLALTAGESFKGVKMSIEDVTKAEHDLDASAKVAMETNTKAAKDWADLLKEIQKLETDRVDTASIGLLGLSRMEQELSQKRMTAAVSGIDQIEKAEADLKDFVAKQSLDSASYQIVQIWKAADAKVAAFKGTADQLAAYTTKVMDLAAAEANAVVYSADKALTTVTEKAVGAARAVQLAIQQVEAGMAVDVVANAQAAGVGRTSGSPTGFGTSRFNAKGVDTWAVPQYAQGGYGDFGTGTLAMLHGKEAIVPLDRAPSLPGGAMLPSSGGGAAAAITLNVYVTQPLGTPTQIADVVGKAVMQSLRNQGARFPSGA